MTCLVCHQNGGESVCPCSSLLHIACLAEMIEHNFWTCPNCCAEFSNESVLRAAMLKHSQQPTLERSIVVAMKLTECGRAHESATLLRGLQRKWRSTCDSIHLKIEYATAMVALRKFHSAARVLENATKKITEAGQQNYATAYIRCRYVYGQALLGLKLYAQAGFVWMDLLQHVPRMHSEEAIKIMFSISEMCVAKNDLTMYKDALKTIVEISEVEIKDPVRKAEYQALLGRAEHEIGIDSSERLRAAIKAMRKRRSSDVALAVDCLAKQVSVRKRLRSKTCVECL